MTLLSNPDFAKFEPYKFMAMELDFVPVSGDIALPDPRWLSAAHSSSSSYWPVVCVRLRECSEGWIRRRGFQRQRNAGVTLKCPAMIEETATQSRRKMAVLIGLSR
ncbi:MAG: hypothetical protein JO108_25810 [Acidobacteriaceae bacterium]|nr:hypothetical protein [Acidobacteriaceae bacterium]